MAISTTYVGEHIVGVTINQTELNNWSVFSINNTSACCTFPLRVHHGAGMMVSLTVPIDAQTVKQRGKLCAASIAITLHSGWASTCDSSLGK